VSEAFLDVLEPITLGSVRQWISVRGKLNQPLLLFLHGGPGSAELAVARHFQASWEKHFLVVNWDQRGSGKSYLGKRLFTITDLVNDALELSDYLLERFRYSKLSLLGHSWGSALGLLMAKQRPELFASFMGSGQLVDGEENERQSFNFLMSKAQQSKNAWLMKQVEHLEPPFGSDSLRLLRQRAWLTCFRGFFWRRTGFLNYSSRLVISRDYSLQDKTNYTRGSRHSLSMLWPELEQLHLAKEITHLDVPTTFCLGRYDYTTPSAIANAYFQTLECKQKKLYWFEHSAHFPHLEEPEKFLEVLCSALEKNFWDRGGIH
jgi:pimeloyl-ACP methyl ester carboxylesterase